MPAWKSSVPGIAWPALPAPQGAALLALQYQFAQSERLAPAALQAQQFRQLRAVVTHAMKTVPWHRERLAAAGLAPDRDIDPQALRRIPLMTRRDVQAAGNALLSTAIPPDHGRPVEYRTGGSTGEPVSMLGTELNRLFWLAFTLRDHLWHRRDFAGTLCAIRSRVDDRVQPGWGTATDNVAATGPCAILNITADTGRQLEWLQQHAGAYLLTHPVNVRALAHYSLQHGIRLPQLKEVRTFGETVTDDLRALCREAWNVPLTDSYSAEETGYLALQCPEQGRYHVQAENVIVELLDDAGQPCAPGTTGRVVVTPLHNFAMPLFRYVLGDYAEAGEACPCGRGLPVLARILGRSRHMFVLPGGRRYFPSSPIIRSAGVAPIQQIQLVQHTLERVEARFVAERALQPDEERGMTAAIQDALGHPFTITLSPVTDIPRSTSMKFDAFVCRIPVDEDTHARAPS
ncbi:MAG: phenylacetate--CoA ligase family protein [Burkholderiales bacterium]